MLLLFFMLVCFQSVLVLFDVLQEYGDCVQIDGFDIDYGVKMINQCGEFVYCFEHYCNFSNIFWIFWVCRTRF